MKKLLYLLLAMPLLFASCSNDEEVASEETVQVSFCTELPGRVGTRASGTLNVNKVVCAVFENGTEINTLRQVIDVTASGTIEYAPRLIKDRTYQVVFWAMKEGCYNVTDLTAIMRTSGTATSESDFESFTESVSITVTGSATQAVTLKRPYAQLNLGVTSDDWSTVTTTFGMTPQKMVIKTTGKDTFNALAGTPTGTDAEITRNLTVSGNDLSVDGTTYKSIAMCYVYPESDRDNFDIKYTISTDTDVAIRENVTIQNVPMQANYRTNVVGGLLTGTITYAISFEEGFTSYNNSEYN